MAIAVYVNPDGMTAAQYDDGHEKLVKAGQGSPKGRLHHSSFGPPDHIMVYDIWEAQEDYEAFGAVLGPILEEVGITMSDAPDIMPIHTME